MFIDIWPLLSCKWLPAQQPALIGQQPQLQLFVLIHFWPLEVGEEKLTCYHSYSTIKTWIHMNIYLKLCCRPPNECRPYFILQHLLKVQLLLDSVGSTILRSQLLKFACSLWDDLRQAVSYSWSSNL